MKANEGTANGDFFTAQNDRRKYRCAGSRDPGSIGGPVVFVYHHKVWHVGPRHFREIASHHQGVCQHGYAAHRAVEAAAPGGKLVAAKVPDGHPVPGLPANAGEAASDNHGVGIRIENLYCAVGIGVEWLEGQGSVEGIEMVPGDGFHADKKPACQHLGSCCGKTSNLVVGIRGPWQQGAGAQINPGQPLFGYTSKGGEAPANEEGVVNQGQGQHIVVGIRCPGR